MPERALREVPDLLRAEARRPGADAGATGTRLRAVGRRLDDVGRQRGMSTDEMAEDVVKSAGLVADEVVVDEAIADKVASVVAVKRAVRWIIAGLDAQNREVSLRRRQERGRILQDFGRALAHEVRNRLGAAETALQMLVDVGPSGRAPDRSRIYTLVRGSMAGAFQTIEDLRALAASVDPSHFPEVRPTPLDEIVRRTVESAEGTARNAGVDLVVGTVPPTPVDGGPARIVVRNLIENSIKYASQDREDRHVWIEGERVDDHVRLSVRDDGVGIPEGMLDHVFQWSARISDATPGDGLGLAIVRDALAQVGGTVELDSSLGEGTDVTVWFPIREER